MGTVLVNHGLISEQDLIDVLRMQLGLEFIDLQSTSLPTELADVLPKQIAKKFQVVPVKVEKDELYLAMSDPLNFYALEEAQLATKRRIIPMIATASGVEHAIQLLYSSEGAAKAIAEMKREHAENGDSVDTRDNAFISTQLGEDTESSAPAIRLVNSILERAIMERASDIHLEPRERMMKVRMRIDGLMRDILTVPNDVQASVISRIKIMSGLDIAERRVPQDGRFNVRIQDKDIDLRISTLPTVYGETVVARLLDKSGGRISKDALGLSEADLEKFDSMLRMRNGVILMVGPTGSGKTTTMYAMINELNKPEVNMVTLEDPVEYNIDGVNQVQINERTGMHFANGLRAILRQDPDIIAVGEIRDGETAEIAMRSAITGHVVLSTIHTNDAVGTIERLKDIGVEPYIISGALRGIISQRLVRRICPRCRKAYTPSEEELAGLGLEPEPGREFFRGEGCGECFNTGYRGRIAVYEILVATSDVRKLIYEQRGRTAIEAELKRPGNGFVSLRENAIRLMLEGVTTSDEVLRVVNEDT